MADTILVLNAGSSSLKFSVFLDGDPPIASVRGQLEGLFTLPHFVARNADGAVIGEKEWPSGTQLAHAGAVEFLFQWGREHWGSKTLWRQAIGSDMADGSSRVRCGSIRK